MALPKKYDERIGQIATGKQAERYRAWCDLGSYAKAAKVCGVAKNAIQQSINQLEKKAAAAGLIANHEPDEGCAPGYKIKGTSTLYDGEGNRTLTWVKTNEVMVGIEDKVREMLDTLREQVPVRDYVIQEPDPASYSDELMACIPMGDPHLGMYAWAEECGDDFNCDICEQHTVEAVDRIVDSMPPCGVCRIEELGDFFHSDTEDAVTRRSGNHLDTDGRWGRVVKIGLRMLTHCVDRCLEKHAKVELVCVKGNHDDQTAFCLAIMLDEHYRNDPRVWVDTQYTTFHFKEFGKVLLGSNHGMIKPQALHEVMTNDQAEAWGRTKFRYWHVGHIHHHRVIELGGCTIEAFRSLKGKDAHEAERGYRSGRDMRGIVYHKEYGEIERHTCNVAMLTSK